MRIVEHNDTAYVDMPLVRYYLGHTQRVEPADKTAAEIERARKNIRETLHILAKNAEYFANNKYAYWVRLSGLAVNYRKIGEFMKSVLTVCKAIRLQPLRLLGNLRIVIGVLMPSGVAYKEKLRGTLQKVIPDRLYWFISSCYRKLMRKFF